jgi:hypothetical protein
MQMLLNVSPEYSGTLLSVLSVSVHYYTPQTALHVKKYETESDAF